MSRRKKKKITYHECTRKESNEGIKEINHLTVVRVPSEPPFVKMYLEEITLLHKLPTNCSAIMYEMLKYMDFSGEVIITAKRRKDIAEKLDISEKTIRNQTTSLVKKGILTNPSTSTYVFNPNLFAKGAWNDVSKLRESFELTIKYTKEGKRKIKGKAV